MRRKCRLLGTVVAHHDRICSPDLNGKAGGGDRLAPGALAFTPDEGPVDPMPRAVIAP